jgi:nicotinamidase-related amidase
VSIPKYDKGGTALLVVDPYNDFISEGGKVWPRIKAVAEANNCVPHMLEVLNAARNAELRVFFAMHHRYRPGDTLRPSRGRRGNTRRSNTGPGAANSAPNSCRRRARS